MSRILYKYRDWRDPNHKKMLTEREIYFSSYDKFNDPFDCRIPWRYELLSDEEAKEGMRRSKRAEMPRLSEAEIERIVLQELPNFRLHLPSRRNEVQRDIENYGIFGLCEEEASLLMWAHYANAHEGFCVGFDEDALHGFWIKKWEEDRNFKIFDLPVEYMREYPKLKPPANIIGMGYVLAIFKYKSIDWAYEREHRFVLFDRFNIPVTIPHGIIKKVILGCRICPTHKDEIMKIIRSWPYRIQVEQARESKDSYSLEFDEMMPD